MSIQFSGENIFDSRDVQDRIDELQMEFDSWKEVNLESEDDEFEDYEELQTLNDFKDEVNSSEWKYGIGFINESYFIDYAEEFANDCGYVDKESVISQFIDWNAFAEWIRQDYTSIEFDGETYYYR